MRTFKPVGILSTLVGAILALIFPSAAYCAGAAATDSYDGRDLIVYVPSRLPPTGQRPLVIVLHGGLGNAQRIEASRSERALNMDAMAEREGFIVAYLNGTPVTRLGLYMLGWNAGGGCCGLSAEKDVDDVGYVKGATRYLEDRYGIDSNRVFGMGHSNGAMMTQRLMCETKIYAAAVVISGPLNLPVEACPSARGKRILALHGQDDKNVPLSGGRGTKGLSNVAYNSEEHTRRVFINSGAAYELQIVKADHFLDDINAALQQSEGRSVQQKAAQFFGLDSGG